MKVNGSGQGRLGKQMRAVVEWMGIGVVGVSGGVNEGCCAVDGDGTGQGRVGEQLRAVVQ